MSGLVGFWGGLVRLWCGFGAGCVVFDGFGAVLRGLVVVEALLSGLARFRLLLSGLVRCCCAFWCVLCWFEVSRSVFEWSCWVFGGFEWFLCV